MFLLPSDAQELFEEKDLVDAFNFTPSLFGEKMVVISLS